MTAQNFPDKHQANSLPVRLGGKEGTEEFSFGLFTYPRTIVNDFDRSVLDRTPATHWQMQDILLL